MAEQKLPDTSPCALVIDDEGAVRAVLRRWLQRRGWEVHEATDGGVALARLQEPGAELRVYDLVICDLRMPALSGPELHAWAASHRPELLPRMVFFSGDTREPAAAAFLARSGCPVLEKPFELPELARVVAQVAPARTQAA